MQRGNEFSNGLHLKASNCYFIYNIESGFYHIYNLLISYHIQ